MMAAPFFAAAYVTRAFLPGMLARGSGSICNVGSPIAYTAWPGAAGYATARWAFRGLTEALRSELRGTGVHLVNVVPTTVASGYFEHNPGFEKSIPGIAKLTGTLTPERVGKSIVERGRARPAPGVRAVLPAHADRHVTPLPPPDGVPRRAHGPASRRPRADGGQPSLRTNRHRIGTPSAPISDRVASIVAEGPSPQRGGSDPTPQRGGEWGTAAEGMAR